MIEVMARAVTGTNSVTMTNVAVMNCLVLRLSRGDCTQVHIMIGRKPLDNMCDDTSFLRFSTQHN